MEARSGDSLLAPTEGTFRLRSPTGAVVVEGAVTIASSVAEYAISAGSLPATLTYGPGYIEEWDLKIGGVWHYPRRDAYVARRALHCPVTQADLLADNPELPRHLGSLISSFDGWRDAVWAETLSKLAGLGRWPEAVLEVSSLAPYVRHAVLARIFLNLNTNTPGRFEAAMVEHRNLAAEAWRGVRFHADFDQDGVADSPDMKPAQSAVVLRSSARPTMGVRSRPSRVLG